MRILQIIAADRWTGAAATALQLVEALRESGIDCHLAYRPGRGLEERLRDFDWCYPILAKERTPADFIRAIKKVRSLAEGFSIVHAHLPHDHLLCRLALRKTPVVLVRSVRHSGHLRADPYHRFVFSTTKGLGLANSAMASLITSFPTLRGVPQRVLPVALEPRFLTGRRLSAARQRLGIQEHAFVAGTIGKIDKGRGHDDFIRAVAAVPDLWGLVIGKGPSEEKLRQLAQKLGVTGRIVFAGYVDAGLEDLYAAMDLFVFPAVGSDHAHRAIAEASGCGVPSLAIDAPGVRDLVEPHVTGELYPDRDVPALAQLLREWSQNRSRCRQAGVAATSRARQRWTPAALVASALDLYAACGVQPRVVSEVD